MPLDLTPTQPPYYTTDQNLPTPTYQGIKYIYKATLAQSGTSAPTATEDTNNTLSGIVWTRSTTGVYIGTLTGAFPTNKTWITATLALGNTGIAYIARTGNNTIQLNTWGINGVAQDNIAQETQIQIIITN